MPRNALHLIQLLSGARRLPPFLGLSVNDEEDVSALVNRMIGVVCTC